MFLSKMKIRNKNGKSIYSSLISIYLSKMKIEIENEGNVKEDGNLIGCVEFVVHETGDDAGFTNRLIA